MLVVLSLSKLHPHQISRQHYTEKREQYRNQINDGACRFKRVRIDLHARLAITVKAGNNQQHARDDRDHAQPSRQSRRGRRLALELKKLLKRDREPPNRKTENDGGNTSANPRQKSAFVRKMVAGAVVSVGHAEAGPLLFHSFLDQRTRPSDVLQEVHWKT